MLSKLHVQNICLNSGTSDQCRYLSEDELTYGVYHCLKMRPAKDKIDKRVQVYLDDCKSKKVDPTLSGLALGDNCQGYLVMRYKEQGYDKK